MTSPGSPHLEELRAIRMVLQRLCREGGRIWLRFQHHDREFPLLAETETHLLAGLSPVEQGQWGLREGDKLSLRLSDRGRTFEGISAFQGTETFEGSPCARLAVPRRLTCGEAHRFSDFRPRRAIACTFTTPSMDIRDGWITSLGMDGLVLDLHGHAASGPTGESLRTGMPTMLSLHLGALRLVLRALPLYLAEGQGGLQIVEPENPAAFQAYLNWVQERIREQARDDLAAFHPSGSKASSGHHPEDGRLGEHATLLVDRDPLVLVVAEGLELAHHLAQTFARKFGIAALDYVKGPLRPTLGSLGTGPGEWGRVRLLLLHQRLRVTSGLELCRELIGEEGCMLPILVAGAEEDVLLKRNRAIASGAVDFISVEPFHVLQVMRAIDGTLKLFE